MVRGRKPGRRRRGLVLRGGDGLPAAGDGDELPPGLLLDDAGGDAGPDMPHAGPMPPTQTLSEAIGLGMPEPEPEPEPGEEFGPG